MDLQSVIVANAIGVLVLGVLLVSSRLVRMRRELGDMLFTLACVLTVFSCTADSLGFGLEGIQGKAMHVILYFFDTVTYLNNIIVSALWCLYVDVRLNGSKKHMLRTLKQISLPGAAGIAGLVIIRSFSKSMTAMSTAVCRLPITILRSHSSICLPDTSFTKTAKKMWLK